ncbi:hypothetical protein IV203_036955 [Nitzschia inconspicua]|uniref:Uncharacterized protein n=1 Tax=Nitzschia inconspicua TaxID=303405 RepID=A0A9K3LHN5_9STRA|nr:hypothetical protein IV203_036955 [Nitzschia inconspicua]
MGQSLQWMSNSELVGEEGYATTMTCRRNRLPKNALALAVAVAYDIYKECLTETAAQEYWQLTDLEKKRNKPLFFFDFRDKLSQ